MWMSHPSIPGVVKTVADSAFYGGWDTLGWVEDVAPEGPPLPDAGWPVSEGEVVTLVGAAVAAQLPGAAAVLIAADRAEQDAALISTYGPLDSSLGFPNKATLTQGLYARTKPLPSGGVGFRALAKDPNQNGVNGTGRLWGVGQQFAEIGYTDDDGATWVGKSAPSETGLSVQSIVFSTNWMWITTASATAPSVGTLWRGPLPDVNGTLGGIGTGAANNQWRTTITAASNGQSLPQATVNIANGNYFSATGGTVSVATADGPQVVTYTGKTAGTLTGCAGGAGVMATGGAVSNMVRMFSLVNLVNGPAGAPGAGGVNATFRNSCFAIDPTETHAILGEYGAANANVAMPALTDGIMATGSAWLYSSLGTFGFSHVGLTITVAGAGAAGAVLTAKVIEIIHQGDGSEAACLRLSRPALTAVTAATITFPATTYGAGVVVGGPSVYHCANPGAAAGSVLWAKNVTFPGGKHIHALKYVSSLPWAAIGDYAVTCTDNGLWVGTTLAGASWIKRSTTPTGDPAKEPINFLAAVVNGQNVILGESDNGCGDGPLKFADTTGTKARVVEPTCKVPYTQTMRSMHLLANGNLIWFGTGEAGAVGPTSCIWISRAPYTVPVLLEDVGATMDTETLGDPVVSNGYVWFGYQRCVQEKFIGQ